MLTILLKITIDKKVFFNNGIVFPLEKINKRIKKVRKNHMLCIEVRITIQAK